MARSRLSAEQGGTSPWPALALLCAARFMVILDGAIVNVALLFLESSQPGLFVAGDIRHGSTKRVASAVGEGAMAVTLVHRYLSKLTSQQT